MSLLAWIEKYSRERWETGRRKYRSHPDEPFNGQGRRAVDHLLDEVADGLNYTSQAAINREVTAWAAGEIDMKLREIVEILDADVRRRAYAAPQAEA